MDFSDYPKINFMNSVLTNNVIDKTNNLFGYGFTLIKWIWGIIFVMTVISVVISLVRLAILADDIPYKKANAKHDLAASLVVLAIIGSLPVIFMLISTLLNLFS